MIYLVYDYLNIFQPFAFSISEYFTDFYVEESCEEDDEEDE